MPRHRLADMKNNVNSYFRSCEKDQLPDVWKFCQVVYQCHITSKNLRRLHSCGLKPQAHRHRNRGRLGPPHFLQSGTRLAPSLFSGRELAFTFAICYRHSFCLSFVCDVGAPYSGGWTFRQFFSPYDSRLKFSAIYFHHTIAQGLYFSGAKNRWWGTPLSPWNLRSKYKRMILNWLRKFKKVNRPQ